MSRSTSKKKTPARTVKRSRSKVTKPAESAVRALRREFGLSQLAMARLLGVSLRTVSRLEGEVDGRDTPRTVVEIRRLLTGLAEIMRREYVATWLDEPTDGFSGLKPIEVVERGELDRIWAAIFRVGSGQPT